MVIQLRKWACQFSTLPLPMRSSQNNEPADGPRSFTELRQVAGTSEDLVQLLVTRPPVYYGNGPFDPPSSDDEEQEPPLDAQHEFEDDAETISLLTRTPVTPGHAETGGLSGLQSRSGTEKVIFDYCQIAKARICSRGTLLSDFWDILLSRSLHLLVSLGLLQALCIRKRHTRLWVEEGLLWIIFSIGHLLRANQT